MSISTKILITSLLIGLIGGGVFISLQSSQSSPTNMSAPGDVDNISQEGGEDLVINGSQLRVKAAEGKCLGISGTMKNLKNGIVPQFFPCDKNSNQQWNYNTTKNEITPASNSNFCLDVPRSKAVNGKGLVLWGCNGGKNQDWSLSNKQISTQLDEKKCVTYNNAGKLELQDCASNDKQIFY